MSDTATNEWGAPGSEPGAWVVVAECGCYVGHITNNPAHRDVVSQEIAERVAAGYRVEPLASLSDMNDSTLGHECAERHS